MKAHLYEKPFMENLSNVVMSLGITEFVISKKKPGV